MPKKKTAYNVPSPLSKEAQETLDSYWAEQRKYLGQVAFYVDSAAILSCLVPDEDRFVNLLKKELNGYRFFTSSHVVAETVRRLAKPTAIYPFRGPANEKGIDLALYFINRWLAEFAVSVICVSKEVYDLGKVNLQNHKDVDGWDLTDAISSEIVLGLEQKYIVSADRGFLRLGIMLMPSDAWTRFKDKTWLF